MPNLGRGVDILWVNLSGGWRNREGWFLKMFAACGASMGMAALVEAAGQVL